MKNEEDNKPLVIRAELYSLNKNKNKKSKKYRGITGLIDELVSY